MILGNTRGRATARNFIGAAVGHHVGGAQERFERARVRPPAAQNTVSERFFLEIHVVDVGDLEFIAPTGPSPADFLEYSGIVEVNAGYGVA